MKYKILENFLDKEFCKKLIEDAQNYSKDDHIPVLNNRLILPCSSSSFLKLIKKSKNWHKLHEQLNSQNFLIKLLNFLNIKNQNFYVTNFFFDRNPNFFLKKYKDINSKKIANVGTISLLYYLFYKFYRFIKRKLKYSFTNKNYVELLYDYSMSPNGYYREIHRDSDARTIVFLIYLNEMDENGSGGELNLYNYLKKNEKIPSQPNPADCKLIESISPKTGTLVTFLNSHDSLHSVSKMDNYNGYRFFLYGSFTLLGKKNDKLKNSMGNLKTNFNIFD